MKLTTGKCPKCSKRFKRIVAYQWKAGHGRRLYNARCNTCMTRLDQTCLPNAKNFILRPNDPILQLRSWQLDEETNEQNA